MKLALFFIILSFLSVSVAISAYRGWTWRGLAIACVSAIFVRIAPNLGNHMYWWHDPYFYFHVVENILVTGSIQPSQQFIEWYGGIVIQTSWPAFHLLASHIVLITGIEPRTAQTFFPALLAFPTVLLSYALFRTAIQPPLSLLGAHLFTMLDLTIFYQTQYHAQGFAITMFLVLIVAYRLYSRLRTSLPKISAIGLLAIIGVVLSHHFSAVMIALILSLYLTALLLIAVIGRLTTRDFDSVFGTCIPIYLLGLTIFGVVLHFVFVDSFIIRRFSLRASQIFMHPTSLGYGPSSPSPYVQLTGRTFVDYFSIITKMIIAGFGIMGGLSTLRNGSFVKLAPFALLTISTVAGTILIAIIETAQLNRVIILGYLFLTPFTILGLNDASSHVTRLEIDPLALVGVAIVFLIMMSAPLAYPPSLIDHDSDIRADSYHQVQPIGAQGPQGGNWLAQYYEDGEIQTVRKLRIVAHYYGHIPEQNVGYIQRGTLPLGDALYDLERYPPAPTTAHKYYSNGRVTYIDNSA